MPTAAQLELCSGSQLCLWGYPQLAGQTRIPPTSARRGFPTVSKVGASQRAFPVLGPLKCKQRLLRPAWLFVLQGTPWRCKQAIKPSMF